MLARPCLPYWRKSKSLVGQFASVLGISDCISRLGNLTACLMLWYLYLLWDSHIIFTLYICCETVISYLHYIFVVRQSYHIYIICLLWDSPIIFTLYICSETVLSYLHYIFVPKCKAKVRKQLNAQSKLHLTKGEFISVKWGILFLKGNWVTILSCSSGLHEGVKKTSILTAAPFVVVKHSDATSVNSLSKWK